MSNLTLSKSNVEAYRNELKSQIGDEPLAFINEGRYIFFVDNNEIIKSIKNHIYERISQAKEDMYKFGERASEFIHIHKSVTAIILRAMPKRYRFIQLTLMECLV